MKTNVVVVAHPDDEIIFASSIIRSSRSVVICFSEIPEDMVSSIGRSQALAFPYIKNIKALKIRQSASSKYYLKRKNNKYKNIFYNLDIKDAYIKKDFELNNQKLERKLLKEIKNGDNVYTHNPWGEYGHIEHIQVFSTIVKLLMEKKIKFKLFVSGYVGCGSFKEMKRLFKFLEQKPFVFTTDKEIYKKGEYHYKKNKCWTWSSNYNLPKKEYFYEVKIKNKNDSFSKSHKKPQILCRHIIETNHAKLRLLNFIFDIFDDIEAISSFKISEYFVNSVVFLKKLSFLKTNIKGILKNVSK